MGDWVGNWTTLWSDQKTIFEKTVPIVSLISEKDDVKNEVLFNK